MDTREPLLRSDWTIYRGGSVMLTGTEDIAIVDSEFDQVGGNAIFVSNYNRRTKVAGCHLHDVGASGVCFVGDPDAVYNPCFEYREKNDLAKIDRTPGPKTNNYPKDGVVEDCLIHGIGRVERQPAGVQIAMALGITIRDCSIYDTARAGINIGDGCWGGHLIERCDVFDTVLETHDHGSFNSWGRDRFWHSDRKISQKFIDKDPQLPFLDALETTVIRDSRWRCDHGWDIDLDDGSTNYDIYNNVMLNGGLKFREGFRRRGWNNITINNTFHPHVWYNNSGDELYSNILMQPHRGVRTPTNSARGARIDRNLFYSNAGNPQRKYGKYGWDKESAVGDPQFVDPASGNFQVAADSPALKLGFKNFPMDHFGVKKPSLRSIARTPEIPELQISNKASASSSQPAVSPPPRESFWLGAKLKDLEGQEFSAYGVGADEGGVAIAALPNGSEAATLGLRDTDLIQGANGNRVKDIASFLQALAHIGDEPVTLTISRDQATQRLSLATSRYLVYETAEAASRFNQLDLPQKPIGKVTANGPVSNQPVKILLDGELSENYGPIFPNGVSTGAYKLDLGSGKKIRAVTSWSHNKNRNRGAQKLTVYGSNSERDPGWDLTQGSQFTPLGSLDVTGRNREKYVAVSLRARAGESLGEYRWIVWSVSPISQQQENSALQELGVEVLP